MHNNVGHVFLKQFHEVFFFWSNVNFLKINSFSWDLFPSLQSDFKWFDGTDAREPIFFINFSSVEIVHDQDIIAKFWQPHG